MRGTAGRVRQAETATFRVVRLLMQRIHLASALLERSGRVLLVASRYPSHDAPLWNLPGGRQQTPELLEETAIRELREETGMRGFIRELAYVAESYDNDRHFLNAVFVVDAEGEPDLPEAEDHVVAAEWVDVAALPTRLAAAVVREPLLNFLRLKKRYTAFDRADISVRWFDED